MKIKVALLALSVAALGLASITPEEAVAVPQEGQATATSQADADNLYAPSPASPRQLES